jgi:hypothetical protein
MTSSMTTFSETGLCRVIVNSMSSKKKIQFKVSVYKKSRAFNIPRDVCREFGIRSGDSIHLVVKTPSGNELFNGRKTLKSGPEVYGKDISSVLTPGMDIVAGA